MITVLCFFTVSPEEVSVSKGLHLDGDASWVIELCAHETIKKILIISRAFN